MRAVLSILFFVLLAGGIFSYLGYLLLQVARNIKPGRSKMENDFQTLKQNISDKIQNLARWDKEDLALLSLNQLHEKFKRGIGVAAQGVLTSIYQEPMVAYAYKRYVSKKINAILYATTSKNQFYYHLQNKEVTIYIDDQMVGQLRENGIIYTEDNRPLARISRNEDELLLPVLVRDREVASVVNVDKVDKFNPRAIELLRDTNDEEEKLLLSLTILDVVQRNLKQKGEK